MKSIFTEAGVCFFNFIYRFFCSNIFTLETSFKIKQSLKKSNKKRQCKRRFLRSTSVIQRKKKSFKTLRDILKISPIRLLLTSRCFRVSEGNFKRINNKMQKKKLYFGSPCKIKFSKWFVALAHVYCGYYTTFVFFCIKISCFVF